MKDWLHEIIERADKAAESEEWPSLHDDARHAMDRLDYYSSLALIALLIERCNTLAGEVERLRQYAKEQCCECFDEWGNAKPHRCHRCMVLHCEDEKKERDTCS